MKYVVKRKPLHKLLVLTGLLSLILNSFINLQAQANVEHPSENSDTEQASTAASATLVQNGFAVVTASDDGSGKTVRIVNIRQFGTLWGMGQFAPVDSSGLMPLVNIWTTSDFQNQTIRGLALSSDGTTIYTSTHYYQSSGNKTPRIFRIGPTSTTPAVPTVLATLPGSLGIGTIDLDEIHGQVCASNIDDGKIYCVNASSGAIVTSFAPLAADASGTGIIPPLGERVWAVAYHPRENRIYYGIWSGSAGSNTIRSVGLNAGGSSFLPLTDRLEITLSANNSPAGDIEFNLAGNRMLVAEEPLLEFSGGVPFPTAHSGRGLEFMGATSSWAIDPVTYQASGRKYGIGNLSGNATNARGGAAWAYSSVTNNGVIGNEQFVVYTGDCLNFVGGAFVYGLQFIPAGGGGSVGGTSTSNSVIADLDYDIAQQDKGIYGDVDIRKSLVPTSAEVNVGGRVTSADGAGIGNVLLTLIEQNGSTKTALTNPFGYFQFNDVGVGQTVIVTITSKRFSFDPSTRAVAVEDEIADLNFTAEK